MPEFTTELWSGDGRNAGIVVPDEILAALGGGKRVPVVVTIDGAYTYRTTTAVMGGKNLVTFNAETRRATGTGIGDEIRVELTRDDAPRTVEVPEALAAARAAAPAAAAAWERLAPSHRKEHARAIADAKAEATRTRRVEKTMGMLRGDA